jgi:hypothetical protein
MISCPLPVDGERVLFCRHAHIGTDRDGAYIMLKHPTHWYYLGKEQTATRSDGSSFEVHWLAVCEQCNNSHTKQNIIEAAAQDAEWLGTSPDVIPYV